MSANFPKFSLLPTELRLSIWQHSLPTPVHQGLYIYKRGCWEAHLVSEDRFHLSFNLSRLVTMRVDVPPFLVNHEAHSVAQNWLHQQAGTLLVHWTPDGFHFTRPFQPASDTLYVPDCRYLEFLVEGPDVAFAPQYEGLNYETSPPAFPRIAFSRSLLQREKNCITSVFDMIEYQDFEEVLVVEDMSEDDEGDLMVLPGVQRPWGWTVVPGTETLVWHNSARAYRREKGCEGDEADAFARLVEQASVGIGSWIGWEYDRLLKVKRVRAIRN
ncbi:hypothetical protein ASPNIDRAFT_53991 [Aspergillus niger ATCC 1015]|uniref:2EXR domain-containing protein n=3 Tax=Aspergillus TaxID=5052 RepID=A0A505IDD9_ASPNG|nr:hypothetical protein ASPNIDRAFT_53991 [Aspergillus niger ATCC 1015]KAI2837883.1 hypothetical protein CBS11350_8548 [Aspergillus niger]RDK45509.1 hypothetical protein M752DRAFT_120089 [Aspergillus phoenicis ATCC 13157]KAI2840889.1 hypothetical protein CBS12448_10518 [Aspergillus niger]KAI2908525.1 hypothetical protein CBS147371_10037 [Aspergillus niger]